jgi:hypothetical protein
MTTDLDSFELGGSSAFVNHAIGGIGHNIISSFVEEIADSQTLIAKVCDEIKELLLEKNRKYGDSALNPTRIFAKSDSVEQIKVRIDDKLNRLKNAQGDEDEDVVQDLIGYLVLLTVAQRRIEIQAEIKKTEDVLDKMPPTSFPIYPYRIGDIYVSPTVDPWEAPTVTWNHHDDGHTVEI